MPTLGQHLIFDIVALVLSAAAGALVYRVAFPGDYKHPALDGYSHYLFFLSLVFNMMCRMGRSFAALKMSRICG